MGVSILLCIGDLVCDFGTSSWLSHVFGVWEIIPVIVRRWVLSSMTKVAQAALRQQGGNATLVRLSKAADVDVANVARSRVVLWVPANVASGPTRGRKPTNQYGAYRVNFSFDSLVPFDVRNDNGVERATLACVLFHTQGVQVVEFDLPQVMETVLDFCAERGKATYDRLCFTVRRTRGQRDFTLNIGNTKLTARQASGWIRKNEIG